MGIVSDVVIYIVILRGQRESYYLIRLDKIKDANGNGVAQGVPYAIMVESDQPIIVQYFRLDTTQAEMALMTTMAYPVK